MNLFRLKDGNYTNQKFNVSALLCCCSPALQLHQWRNPCAIATCARLAMSGESATGGSRLRDSRSSRSGQAGEQQGSTALDRWRLRPPHLYRGLCVA
jgi:hypothetical protein